MLRDEKEAAVAEIQTLKKTVEELENKLSPLQSQNTELNSKIESLGTEIDGLKQDLTKWRNRASLLLEKTTKVNPEEFKKLQTERDTLTRQCASLQESGKQQQGEITRHVQQVKLLQQKVTALQTNVTALTQDNKALTEENKKVNDEVTTLKAENDALTAENSSVKETLTAKEKEAAELQDNLTKSQAETESQRDVVRQVRNVFLKLTIYWSYPLSIYSFISCQMFYY